MEFLVQIPFLDQIKVYLFAIYFSGWILFRHISAMIWNREFMITTVGRNNPPQILTDPTLGRHSYVKVKGVKLHYVELGDKTSPPLLLLHGFPDCWIGWREQLGVLSGYYRVIAVDLKGFGDSDKPRIRFQYRLPELIEELECLIKSICEDTKHNRVTLIGHDLGGLLGWYMLYSSPSLISKFVAVSAPHPNVFWDSLNESTPLNYKWMNAIQMLWLPEEESLKDDMAFLTKCNPNLKFKPDYLEAYKYAFSRHEDWTGPLNYYRNIMFWRIASNTEVIDKPIALIIGNKDTQVSIEAMVRSSEWCSNATVKILDGSGHFPHQENPATFNGLISRLLIGEKRKPIIAPVVNEKVDILSDKGLISRLFGAVNVFV